MGGALWPPGDASSRRGGGGMAVLAPGASHRPGGRALPPPASTESRILAQALAGAPHPPAVVARRSPAGGGREGERSVVSGLRGSFPPPSPPREVARSHASCRTVGPARARGLGGGATARVNGGAQRAHHPSDRSVSEKEGGGGVGGALWSPGAAL